LKRHENIGLILCSLKSIRLAAPDIPGWCPGRPCRGGSGPNVRCTLGKRRRAPFYAGKGRLARTLAFLLDEKVPVASRCDSIAAALRRQLLKASGSQRRMYRGGGWRVPLRHVESLNRGGFGQFPTIGKIGSKVSNGWKPLITTRCLRRSGVGTSDSWNRIG
jgi:hypothetical protein